MPNDQISLVPLLSLLSKFLLRYKYQLAFALLVGICFGFWRSQSNKGQSYSATYFFQSGSIPEELLSKMFLNLNEKRSDSTLLSKLQLTGAEWASTGNFNVQYHEKSRPEDDYITLNTTSNNREVLVKLPKALQNYLLSNEFIRHKQDDIKEFQSLLNSRLASVDSLSDFDFISIYYPKTILNERSKQGMKLDLAEKKVAFNRINQNGSLLVCIDYIISDPLKNKSLMQDLKINILKYSFFSLSILLILLFGYELAKAVNVYNRQKQ